MAEVIWDTAGRCGQHGKVNFTSRRAAMKTAKRWRNELGRMSAFRCGQFWHLGHLPQKVKQGEIGRDEL